jgi:hypothetical protein
MYRNCGGALGLDEKRPVIWAYHKIAHISVEEGVYRFGADFAGQVQERRLDLG